MRVVVALGGNALLRRGQPLTAQNQRENVARACAALAPLALEHELVISHGNGPQVGLLALQGAAYTKVETYPLDVLDSQTQGMIGYLIMQELGNLLPFEKPLATLLTMIEVDPHDPAFQDPTKPIGPIYSAEEAAALAAEKGWAFKPDGDSMRRVVPSPQPKRIFGVDEVGWLLEHGSVVICAGGGGIPTIYTDEPTPAGRRLTGVEAVIDKDLASALLAADIHADALLIVTDVDAVYADWGTPQQHPIRSATPAELGEAQFASGSMGPKVRAACNFVEQTGGFAAIGSIDDAQTLLAGTAGTRVAPAWPEPLGAATAADWEAAIPPTDS
jgi:carbamate kinase